MSATVLVTLIVVAVYIIISLIFHLEPRVAVAMALGLLIAGAVALTTGKMDLAEELATYFYYFLGAGLLLTMIQRMGNSENKDRGEKEIDT